MDKLTYDSEYAYSNDMEYNADVPVNMYLGSIPVMKMYIGSLEVTGSFIPQVVSE